MGRKIVGIFLLILGGLWTLGALIVMLDNVYLAVVYDPSYISGMFGGLLVLLLGYFTMKSGYERIKTEKNVVKTDHIELT